MKNQISMDKKIGSPLGRPELNKGEAAPEEAGAEGGTGFVGDQRTDDNEVTERSRRSPPLDGTITGLDIEGDTDKERPGA